MISFRTMDRSDQYTIAGIIATLVLWWIFVGKGKYGMKGRRSYA